MSVIIKKIIERSRDFFLVNMNIAVITGASSGMGREMAQIINDEIISLDEIWLIARREERLIELNHLLDCPVKILCFDLLDDFSIIQYENLLQKHKPNIRFLVNAAGFGSIGDFQDLTLENQSEMLKLNTQVLMQMCKISLPYMHKNSRIINFASAAAFLPQPGFSIYAASKSFVLSFSRSLNVELTKRKIYVTAVCPGPVKTEFFDIAEESGKIPVYKYLFMANPYKVCKKAFMDSIIKKDISVYGTGMKAFLLCSKLLPHKLIFRIMKSLNYLADLRSFISC